MTSQRAIFPLPVEYKLQRDVTISSDRIINMYTIPANDTSQKNAWVPVSGFETPHLIGDGNHRTAFVFKDFLYTVSGTSVERVDSLLIGTNIGTIGTASGYIGITANEIQVIFVDGTAGYIYNTVTSVFSTIVFGFSFLPTDVTMLDNYFIAIDPSTTKFYVSALNDGTSWNALSFAIFQSTPDQLVAIKTLKRRLYLFGNISIEVWYDAGALDFPLRRDNNSLFEHGCASRATVQEGFEIMLYVAKNRDGSAGVMLIQGTAFPQKVSTPEVDLFLQNLQNIQDSQAILYQENGMTFYQLSFNTDNRTLGYIVETNHWHEIEMPNGNRSPIATYAFFTNKHLVGMVNSNIMYEMSYKFFTFANELIRCRLISPQFYLPTNQRIRIDRFQLEPVVGIPEGTLANQEKYPALNVLVTTNDEPEVILSISRDGGRTYGNGIRKGMGKLGEYLKRVIWRRLGVQRERRLVIQLEFPYKVPFIVMGAYIIFEALPQ